MPGWTKRATALAARTAATEFALILPALLIMLLAGVQITQFIDASRKVEGAPTPSA